MQLLAHGYTNREAADELGLSMRSVETYRSRMAEKLGFQSKVDLVKFAKLSPAPAENEASVPAARRFIVDTTLADAAAPSHAGTR